MWSRFFPAYKQLRQELSSGSIGDVKGMTAYFGVAFNREKVVRMFDTELGGGVTKDIGVYLVQLACLVFDNEKPEICVTGQRLDTGESSVTIITHECGVILFSVTSVCLFVYPV